MALRREIPTDFAERATQPVRILKEHYGATSKTIVAWRRALGIQVPCGAPKRNQNSVNNRSRKKETHGIDDIEAVRTCLSCTRPRCTGQCINVH